MAADILFLHSVYPWARIISAWRLPAIWPLSLIKPMVKASVPDAYVQKDVPSLKGLDGQKMSKSYTTIPLFSDTDILRRLTKIKTDSSALKSLTS